MKKVSLLLFILLLLNIPLANSVEIPSSRPEITRADQVFAQAKQDRDNNGIEEEKNTLLHAWRNTSEDEVDMDQVALRLAEFARRNQSVKQELLSNCTRNQLVRLTEKSEQKDEYRGVIMFAEEFRDKYPNDEEYASISNDCATALMLTDVNENRAQEIWGEIKNDYPDSKSGKLASLCLEAVNGPESVASLEMASRIGVMQSQEVNNPYRALFSHWRVLKAADKDFFKQYINASEVPEADRAELLYIVLQHAHLSAKYEKVPDLAGQIFTLVDYDSELSRKAAFAVPLSQYMRGMHNEAIAGFENFLRSWPDAPESPRASLYLGRAFEQKHNLDEAILQYAVTVEKYNNSRYAIEAKVYYEKLLEHDPSGNLEATLKQEKSERIAFFEQPLDPSEKWQKCQLPEIEDKKVVRDINPEKENRFVRLATVLNK